MKLKPTLLSFFTVISLFAFSSFTPETSDGWTSLLDKNLSKWEIYQSYSFKNSFDGKQPTDENGKLIEPVGYNKNDKNVFTVDEINGEPVLHISGEIYGCVFTKQEFENYHLTLKVKWGEKKWEPRMEKLKDSGLLYHSVGECGVDYWRSWMLSQEFQIMEGHMGDYWGIANSAIDVRAFLPEGAMNTVASEKRSFLPIGPGTGHDGFCLRSADFESPADEWTTIELICFGDKSLHIINGHVVMVLKNSRFVTDGKTTPLTKGKIQLQSEAGEVYFKDIRIKPIRQIPEVFTHYFN
ncbi:MAG: DUF1080 domain-containing protein [Prolixibacteraceae bacterium]